MKPIRTIDRRPVLTAGDGRFLRVEDHTVEFPDGQVIEDWPWVITPDYVNVVATSRDDRFLCFRQMKYAVAGETLALVGGYIEANEDPLVGARRELLEETGYTSSNWHALGKFAVDGNRGCGTAHLYWAQDVEPAETSLTLGGSDDLEPQEILWIPQAQIREDLRSGKFQVLAWTTALSMVLERQNHMPLPTA